MNDADPLNRPPSASRSNTARIAWLATLTVLTQVASLGANAAEVEFFALSQVRLGAGPFLHAQQLDRNYLLALEADRLLAGFRSEAGLEPRAAKYPNWESSGLDGHTLGHYLTALAQMWAATGDAEMKERLDHAVAELAECQRAHGNGYVGAVPHSRELWTAIAAGAFDAQGFSLKGAWVPWYNVHKTFAGLRDAWLIAGNAQARDVLIGLADWCAGVVAGLSEEKMQIMLRAEHGGMNEVLADVYAITGDDRYLALARRFSHRAALEPLLRREDQLTGQHANTQIPKVIGFARIAELSNAPAWHDAADFFWDTVVRRRSVAFGGNSVREHFNPPDDFSSMLESREGPESCNTYNMLRLTEALFRHDARGRYADYYERALYNHILSTQHPEHGGFVYFTPIRPRHYRVYSQPSQCFWCCVGSGIENHGKYGRFIYAHSDDELFVNLFIASALDWPERGMKLRQETQFPDEETTRLIIALEQPQTFALRLRIPGWVRPGQSEFSVSINGETVPVTAVPDGYARIEREWRDGDRIEMRMRMGTSLQPLPDDSGYYAITHGPILLAAKTGAEDLDGLIAGDARMGHVAPGAFRPVDAAPMLIGDPVSVLSGIQPVPDRPLTFTARSVIRPDAFRDLELEPFFRVHDARYMLYWRIVAPDAYAGVVAALEAGEKERLELEGRTVDRVVPGEQQPEVEHNFRGENTASGTNAGRSWRDATGWFGYDFKTAGETALEIQVTTFGRDRGRAFEIVVNEHVIATVDLTEDRGERFETTSYRVPGDAVAAADGGVLRIDFRAQPGSRVAGIYDVRLVRASKSD